MRRVTDPPPVPGRAPRRAFDTAAGIAATTLAGAAGAAVLAGHPRALWAVPAWGVAVLALAARPVVRTWPLAARPRPGRGDGGLGLALGFGAAFLGTLGHTVLTVITGWAIPWPLAWLFPAGTAWSAGAAALAAGVVLAFAAGATVVGPGGLDPLATRLLGPRPALWIAAAAGAALLSGPTAASALLAYPVWLAAGWLWRDTGRLVAPFAVFGGAYGLWALWVLAALR